MNNKVVKGKNGVKAQVVEHSYNTNNPESEVITMNLCFGLIVLGELTRHRTVTFSVKSNRAISGRRMRREVLDDPYVPLFLGKDKKGMVSDEEIKYKGLGVALWRGSRYLACGVHFIADKLLRGHKEWVNRLLNPWQFVSLTMTATELDNLYNLRLHRAAQRDIQEVVRCAYEAHKSSVPKPVSYRNYHLPYVQDREKDGYSLSECIEMSTARCARSSYNNHDKSDCTYEKDRVLCNSLVSDKPMHSSPIEHPCKPMRKIKASTSDDYLPSNWEKGVTHIDKDGNYWSGNFKGFIQQRQLLKDNVCTDYTDELHKLNSKG